MKSKRGVSPVVATVLLIGMVVVIGIIIFLWFKGFTQEAITKQGTNIELVCNDVDFDASYSSGMLYISNDGDIPIYGMKLKISQDRSHDTVDLEDFEGLNQGASFSEGVDYLVGSANSITLIPVLLGTSEQGERTFLCEQNSYEILI
ncbi:MAG: archaellin/type IV pilin N-terminal domain-containing protein [archaeon]